MNVIQIWLFDLRHECVLGLEYYHTPVRCFQNTILITGLTLCEISHSLPPNTHTQKKSTHITMTLPIAAQTIIKFVRTDRWDLEYFCHSFYGFELRFSSVYQMEHIFLLIVQMYIVHSIYMFMKMLLWYIVILYNSLHFHLLQKID